MTNYEWLVKKGELGEFLRKIPYRFYSEKDVDAFDKAAAFLRATHTDKYVKLSAVEEAIAKCWHDIGDGNKYFSDTTLLNEIREAAQKYGKDIEDDT